MEALALLDEVLRGEPGLPFPLSPYDWLLIDPRLESLRKDRRFQPILDRSRQQFRELLKLLDAAKTRDEFPQHLEKPLADLRTRLGE